MDPRRRLGKAGEDLVCRRLRARGWRIIGRNVRTRYGEIDVIAVSPARVLAFIEVKTRRAGNRAGPTVPVESVGPRKSRRIRRLAAAWLAENRGIGAASIRFDVAGVEVAQNGAARIAQYVAGAF